MDTQYTRVINKDTITLLTQELSLQSWDILNLYDVNQAYDLFLNKFIGLFNKHCPIRISRKSNIYKKPWFNKGLKCACAKKKTLLKAFVMSCSHEAELKYKSYKNKLTSILRFTENAYYHTVLLKMLRAKCQQIVMI